MRVKQGQGYRIQTTVEQRNLDGTYTKVDPTTILGTLLLPDQTTTPFTPSKDAVGEYHADLSPTLLAAQTGPYQWKVITTGPGAGEQDGSFEVVDPFATEVLSTDDARDHLMLSGTIPAGNALSEVELETYVAAATEAIEAYIGPVGRRTVTETVYPSSGVLLLRTTPVLSLTSVTPYGSAALTVGSLTVNTTAGIVYPGTYGGFWASSYTVVYVAGRASVPASVNTAARLIVQRLAETQRGGLTSPGRVIGAAPEDFGAGGAAAFAYLKSYGVRELLDPYRLAPAVA